MLGMRCSRARVWMVRYERPVMRAAAGMERNRAGGDVVDGAVLGIVTSRCLGDRLDIA
ncbi:hypothetical protein GCM10010411_61620 [Actinomadura fulvescens]|uniref:Transposase n=1 Tax=Actinomadura fulvescens TaxID=46160 RepID=A0ABN3Q5P1_9ACTN